MTEHDITTKQASKIFQTLAPTLGFLTQLEVRLGEMGVSPLDPYYQKVVKARDAFHSLTVETHYRSCESGVCRGERGKFGKG